LNALERAEASLAPRACADELQALRTRFPLPDEAAWMDPYVDSVDIGGFVLHLAGFAVQFRGECITGSAGSPKEPPVVRAYMELVERLVVASTSSAPKAASVGAAGETAFRPARSNGVAIGRTPEDAAERATWELVERDRILRSWYGDAAPIPALVPRVPEPLLDLYSFEACLFEPTRGIQTAGVFGFPRHDAPLIYGFAARDDAPAAIIGARDECLQRLGFLWGEDVPVAAPDPLPTPSFHQDYFLYPAHHGSLRAWLKGEHARFRGLLTCSETLGAPTIEALRPPWLSPFLHVARAAPSGHVPLGFGAAHPLVRRPVPPGAAVHPIV
jgi:hypothetical protein